MIDPRHGSKPGFRLGETGSKALTDVEWRAVARYLGFTPREVEIVRGVFDNETDRAIAGALGLSVNTVHSHLRRIYAKIGGKTRMRLAVAVFVATRFLARRGVTDERGADLAAAVET